MASTGKLSRQEQSALVSAPQVDAFMRMHAHTIDLNAFLSQFPSLSQLNGALALTRPHCHMRA